MKKESCQISESAKNSENIEICCINEQCTKENMDKILPEIEQISGANPGSVTIIPKENNHYHINFKKHPDFNESEEEEIERKVKELAIPLRGK